MAITTAATGEARTEPATGRRLTGFSGDPGYFRFKEYRTFDPQAVVDVLRGRSAGAVFRGVVEPEICTELSARFWDSGDRERRTAVAPSYYLGTYHFHKTTEEYLDESERTTPALEKVLDIPRDPLTGFYDGLAGALAPEDVTVRRAEHGGRQACRGLLRSWHGAGDYTLDPHEDGSQCTDPRQADFEIQRVLDHHVCALNICLENGDGGRLALWNIRPDEASRRRLGLEHTGSPYPMDTLDGIECQWLEINAGDIYVFNGAHIHAVEPNTSAGSRRTTLAGIFGFVDRDTVVSWT
ncbi:hypothetical protein D9753_11240 [Streptomyces dangxiongensis]|uniref:Fe2OG dioxygenase domain-containing protein n=1 Tax=Streptomyces dangxiongensis TaxID=1442032 RepID=A0A3G2JAR6_9ACTN|nr:hypothetical protein [Streptomyces dangxiongensis]AYN39396.1 hypothetical protein D9753_11240 [Streptomyces dangxiongensis]